MLRKTVSVLFADQINDVTTKLRLTIVQQNSALFILVEESHELKLTRRLVVCAAANPSPSPSSTVPLPTPPAPGPVGNSKSSRVLLKSSSMIVIIRRRGSLTTKRSTESLPKNSPLFLHTASCYCCMESEFFFASDDDVRT